MNLSSGALEFTSKATGIINPAFLAIDAKKRHLYSVNEVREFGGKPSGSVSAFSIDQKTGALTYLNRQPSQGIGPCHLTVGKTGKYVRVANYGGGSLSVLPIHDDGQLGEATDIVQHQGPASTQNGRQVLMLTLSFWIKPIDTLLRLISDYRVMTYRFGPL